VKAEARTGRRWFDGTDRGHEYQRRLVWGADESGDGPGLAGRTVGDLVDPTRAGSVTAVVNLVTRAVGTDAAGWGVPRLVGMAGQIEHDRNRQGRATG